MSVMSRPRQVDLSCFLQATLGCIGAQCGRQEAWTTVDLALIRGLVPHDQGSSWGFLCLANARRIVPATNPRSRVPPTSPACRPHWAPKSVLLVPLHLPECIACLP